MYVDSAIECAFREASVLSDNVHSVENGNVVSFDKLNAWYTFEACFSSIDELESKVKYIDESVIIIKGLSVVTLLSRFQMFTFNNLFGICKSHNISFKQHARKKERCMLSIMRHDCMRSCCSNVFYVFRSRHFIRRLTKDFCSYTFHRDENDLLLALGNRQGDVSFDSSCHLPSSSCRFSSNSGRNAFPNESDSSGVNDVVDNSNNVVNESTYPFPKIGRAHV